MNPLTDSQIRVTRNIMCGENPSMESIPPPQPVTYYKTGAWGTAGDGVFWDGWYDLCEEDSAPVAETVKQIKDSLAGYVEGDKNMKYNSIFYLGVSVKGTQTQNDSTPFSESIADANAAKELWVGEEYSDTLYSVIRMEVGKKENQEIIKKIEDKHGLTPDQLETLMVELLTELKEDPTLFACCLIGPTPLSKLNWEV